MLIAEHITVFTTLAIFCTGQQKYKYQMKSVLGSCSVLARVELANVSSWEKSTRSKPVYAF